MPQDIYQRVTDTILSQLKTADPASWVCPWHGASRLPENAVTRRRYHGVNVISLWCGAKAAEYPDNRWATYQQWMSLGAKVRRGQHGTPIVFYKNLLGPARESQPEEDDQTDGPRLVARTSVVFNAAQVDGAAEPTHRLSIDPSLPDFDRFVAATGAAIRLDETRACYSPSTDTICMPPRDRFRGLPAYVATLTHELVHWTGAPHRLNRDLTARFGSRRYAGEELVAELGAAFVLADLGLAREPHPQHAAYMASWLELLKADPRAIFTAAAHATRAAAALQAFQIAHHLQDA